MRLAWFHPGGGPTSPSRAHTALVAAEVGRAHEVAVFDAASAHHFVPAHFRRPFDLCVYEVGDSPDHAFVTPYALHFPGVVALQATWLPDSRLTTSLVVAADAYAAARLRDAYDANVRVAPAGAVPGTGAPAADLRVGGVAGTGDLLARAAARARAAGTPVEVTGDLQAAAVVVALEWPPAGSAPPGALAALASGQVVITQETEATAGWPALDPQTWQPRGEADRREPIAITVDPRDEEHSVMLALKRLAGDADLRARLGRAGRAWWADHHTPDRAREAWLAIIEEAAGLTFTPAPGLLDGTQTARAILAEIGVEVDFL